MLVHTKVFCVVDDGLTYFDEVKMLVIDCEGLVLEGKVRKINPNHVFFYH